MCHLSPSAKNAAGATDSFRSFPVYPGMSQYKVSLLFVLGVAALCFMAVPLRGCSREDGHVRAR
jgi:hypothetical protein